MTVAPTSTRHASSSTGPGASTYATDGPGANGGLLAPAASSVQSSYLGYPIQINKQRIRVFTPAGRKVADVTSVKQARLLVRWCRREERGR